MYKDELMHIGTKTSGRYPRGSGERPYQHGGGPRFFKSRKQKKAEVDAAKKEASREKTPEEIEKIKSDTLKSKSAKELYKNKDYFTYKELQDAKNRLDLERQVKELSEKEVKQGKTALQKIDTAVKVVDKVVGVYGTYQKFVTASQKIEEARSKKNDIERKAKQAGILKKGSYDALYKNRDLFKPDEFEKANSYIKSLQKLEKKAEKERKRK